MGGGGVWLARLTLRFMIGNEFRPQGYKIVSRDLPNVVVWVGKFFSSMMKELYASLGKNLKFSNEHMVSELALSCGREHY